jgi:CRP-like cAMP-binding protein
VLEGLSPEDVRELCRFALVMEIPAHKVVLREGLVERELYVVLCGRFEVVMAGHKLAELGAGDVLGEVSFFQTPGERVATVRAVTPARVMVLERHFLERLLPDHPQLALRVLFNLARIVSGHLAVALRAYTNRI